MHLMLFPLTPDAAVGVEKSLRQLDVLDFFPIQAQSKERKKTVVGQKLHLRSRIHLQNLENQIVAGLRTVDVLPHSPTAFLHRPLSQTLPRAPHLISSHAKSQSETGLLRDCIKCSLFHVNTSLQL